MPLQWFNMSRQYVRDMLGRTPMCAANPAGRQANNIARWGAQ
jgi:hypothetical protein